MEQLATVLPPPFPMTPSQRAFNDSVNAQLHQFLAIIDHRLDAGDTDDHTEVNRDFDRKDIEDSRGFALKGYLGVVDPNETAEEREERKEREGYYDELEKAEAEEDMGDGRIYVVDGEFDENGNQVIMRGGLVWEGGAVDYEGGLEGREAGVRMGGG